AYANDEDIEAYIATCTAIHGVRTRFIYAGLTALDIKCTEPEGAFYLTVNFDHWRSQLAAIGIQTSPQLASYLLDEHDLATLSCDAFGVDPAQLSLRLASSYLDMEQETDSQRLIALFENGISDEEFMSDRHHPNVHAALDEFALFVQKISSR
ncbi:MAG: aminotransferase class I/II-fold pyridoxal phosphate-dependent enzyme, partial [Gammaproteobacteria bacterium]|nr:aminotransferase class I/II-fold pyridoxal phosphate-dependent enzyme [Gammaproteobacteria bacterium]